MFNLRGVTDISFVRLRVHYSCQPEVFTTWNPVVCYLSVYRYCCICDRRYWWILCIQAGTPEDEHLRGGAVGSDGSTVLVGHSKGDWNGTNAGDYDFVALKVDAQGEIIWKWQVKTIKRLTEQSLPGSIRSTRKWIASDLADRSE